jgi:hypothetical protein
LRKSSTATSVAALNWCLSIGSGLARIMSIIQPRIVLRLIRGLVIEHRIPLQSVRPFWGGMALFAKLFLWRPGGAWRADFGGYRDGSATAGVIGHDPPQPPERAFKPRLDGEKMAVTGADSRPPKRRRMTAMAHFAGLDVSIEETAVCVVDEQGAVVMQCSVATEPEAIAKALAPFAATLKRAGHEAGSL